MTTVNVTTASLPRSRTRLERKRPDMVEPPEGDMLKVVEAGMV